MKIEFESDQEKEIIYNLSGVKVNRNIKERDKMTTKIEDCIYYINQKCKLELKKNKNCFKNCDYFKKEFWKKHRFEYKKEQSNGK